MDARVIDTRTSRKWISVTGGVEVQVLNSESGALKTLVRMAPGKTYPSHRHPAGEEIFVLEGDYSDEDAEYGPGSYVHYAHGSEHAPRTRGGCLVLVMAVLPPVHR